MRNSGKSILPDYGIQRIILIFLPLLLTVLSSCSKDPFESLRLDKSLNPLAISIIGKDTLELNKTPKGWFLDSGPAVDSTAIENFFYIFQNLEISGISRNMNVSGMKKREISIVTTKEEKHFIFYSDSTGNFLKPAGESVIYRISITSVPDSLIARSLSPSESLWGNRLLLNIQKDNFEKISLSMPADGGFLFMLKKENNRFLLIDSSGNNIDQDLVSTENCEMYLRYLKGIYTEGRIRHGMTIEQLRSSDPLYSFIVKQKDRQQRKFIVYSLYDRQGGKSLFHGAIKEDGQPGFMKINYIYLDPLLQNQSYFTVE